jgi:hypothetical protein
MSYTPGPWTVEYVESGGYDTLSSAYRIKYGEDSRRERVCEVDTRDYDDRIETADFGVETSVEAEANAHLIAAAPEMYEQGMRFLLSIDDPSRHDCGTDGIAACAWCSFYAVLRKAVKAA